MSAVKHPHTDSKKLIASMLSLHTHTKIVKGKFSVAGNSMTIDSSFSNYLVSSCLD